MRTKRHLQCWLFGTLLACISGEAAAAACTTAVTGGNWSVVASWTCVPGPNHVPVAADTVTIDRNFVVNVATANVVSITMTGGTLTQSSALNTAGPLAISGGTLNSTNTMAIGGLTTLTGAGTALNINATTGTHTYTGGITINAGSTFNNAANEPVTIGASLSNDGTFNSGTGAYTFSGAGGGQWTGAAGLSFGGNVSITNGARTSDNTVSITGTLAVTAPGTLTNTGTVTVGGNVTVTGTLRNDAGALTMNGATGVTVTGGTFRIEGGTVTVGNAADERVVLTSNAATTFLMNGGTLDVAGRITNSAAAGAGSFTLTNGTITVGISGNTQNNVLGAPFFIASGMTFTMSGGTIVIQSSNTTLNAREYDVNSAIGNSTITGGTVQIGNGSSAAGQTFQIESVPAIPNLTVHSANTPTALLLTAAITVNGNVVIGATGTLNANSLGLAVGGNWTNDGTFTPGTQTVTLNGGAAQTISGSVATGFNSLTLNNAAGAALSGVNATVSGTLTFTSGNLSTAANLLTIGAAGSIAGAATSRHVIGNLAKIYSAATTFTYGIGDGTNYTPVSVVFSAAATGSLTATTPTTAGDHPNTTDSTSSVSATTGVNRYWTLKGSTITGTYAATLNYINPGDLDAGVAPACNVVVARGTTCSGSGVSRYCAVWSRPTLGAVSCTQATATGIPLASGDPETDFVVGEAATARFSREKEFIYTRERY